MLSCRASLWLAVDRPELVSRLVLAASSSETPPDSPMTDRMGQWIHLGERGEWGELFALQGEQLKAGGPESDAPSAGSFAAAAALQPRPSTPERSACSRAPTTTRRRSTGPRSTASCSRETRCRSAVSASVRCRSSSIGTLTSGSGIA